MIRLTLDEIRRVVLLNVDDEWRTPSAFYDAIKRKGRHRISSNHWYRIALVLERLANDGLVEIRVTGRKRSFRRAA